MKRFCSFFVFFCFWSIAWALGSNFALAEELQETNLETLVGSACERIKNDETLSSVRLRATDKATFEAVKNLAEIKELEQVYSEHDLNVLIYSLVDNYIEDLNTKTTQQDEQKICVEVSGYIQKDNIILAQEDFLSTPAAEPNQDATADDDENISQTAPIEVAQDQAEKTALTVDDAETGADMQNKKLIYIAPLEFFNNTKSKNLVAPLKNIFSENGSFVLTENQNQADYLIVAKVLKAKVDALNAQTKRLQMVVSVTATLNGTDNSFTEHQNRFILFEANDDEQKVAADLMNKLLSKAGKMVMKKVERDAKIVDKSSEAFITPKASS